MQAIPDEPILAVLGSSGERELTQAIRSSKNGSWTRSLGVCRSQAAGEAATPLLHRTLNRDANPKVRVLWGSRS